MLHRYSIKMQNAPKFLLKSLKTEIASLGEELDTWKLFKEDLSYGKSAFSNCHHTKRI